MERSLAIVGLGVQKIVDGFQQLMQLIRRRMRQLGNSVYGHVLRWLRAIHLGSLFVKSHETVKSPKALSPVSLHALIIGINEYKSTRITNLAGATVDADEVDKYLRTELHVPTDQIVNLRDKGATRDAILRELQALQTRESISKADSIIIFYAGYGATTDAPDGWFAESNPVSFIVPHDGLVNDVDGQYIYPVPDRTINALLYKLSERKGIGSEGGGITVILDCCYSGPSTNQIAYTPPRLLRGCELDPGTHIPIDLDEHVWKDVHATTLTPGFLHPGGNSHIITLAACREGGVAQEVGSRGLFTQALVEALHGVCTSDITYLDLIRRIPNIPGQTPVCDRHDAERLPLGSLVPGQEKPLYEVSLKDDKLVVDAGFLQGVSPDAQFFVYTHRQPINSEEPLAIMEPKSVHASSTDLTYTTSSPTRALESSSTSSYFATQTSSLKVAGLRLYVAPSEPESRRSILEALAKVSQPRTSGAAILLVDDATRADLSVQANGDRVQYLIHEPLIAACGLPELRQTTKAETKPIYPVLRAAAHFFRFLRHSPTEIRLRDTVRVEVYALETDEEGELGPDLRRPWITCGSNLYDSGFVDVIADDDTPYGIKVHNDSEIALHVWAFYFDCSGLAISEYYRPPATGPDAEPSLPACGVLTIGYGAGGGLPYTFFLREGQDLDLGFIKLFISTQPIDFSSLEQRSPFKDPVARGKKKRNAEFEIGWDTITIAVVQRQP